MDGATKIDHFIGRKNKDGPKEVSGIPLVIYETWHTDMIPNKMKECIDNLINMNRDFDYYLYTKEQCAKFIEDNFDKDVLDAYNSLKPMSYKADLWRYCVIYKKGGVYLDTKFTSVEPNTPFIDLLRENQYIYVKDVEGSCPNEGSYGYANGFLASPANNIVFKHCIDEIVNNCKTRKLEGFQNELDPTGPCVLRRSVMRKIPNYETNFMLKPKHIYKGDKKIDNHEIYYKDKCILRMYPEYREEQERFHDGNHVHHTAAFSAKDIYN